MPLIIRAALPILIVIVTATGCANHRQESTDSSIKTKSQIAEMNHWIYTTGVPGANGRHYNTRMEAAPDIANQLIDLEPVQSANVLLSDRNAYVAVTAKDGRDLDQDVDATSTIAQKVQAMRPGINNIYVSADPYFVQKADQFKNDLFAGNPVSGLLGEFNMIVQTLFPPGAESNLK